MKKLTTKERKIIELVEEARGAASLIYRMCQIPEQPIVYGSKEAMTPFLLNAIESTAGRVGMRLGFVLDELKPKEE